MNIKLVTKAPMRKKKQQLATMQAPMHKKQEGMKSWEWAGEARKAARRKTASCPMRSKMAASSMTLIRSSSSSRTGNT